MKDWLEIVFLCIVFLGVLGLTYFVTKKIGAMNKQINFNKNMQIIEMMPLMQGQYLYIIKVGQSYSLMACSQRGNITYIKDLDEHELNLTTLQSKTFQEHFINFTKGKQGANDEHKE